LKHAIITPQKLSLPQIELIMLQVSVLRNNTEDVKKRLAVKHFAQPELVDTIIALDDERKRLQAEFDNTQARVNAASKEIGKMMAQGNKEGAESIKTDVGNWKAMLEPLKEQMAKVEKDCRIRS
jgi:seryl-tRNA synthetase